MTINLNAKKGLLLVFVLKMLEAKKTNDVVVFLLAMISNEK